MPSIAIFADPDIAEEKLIRLQAETSLNISQTADYLLYITANRLELRATKERKTLPVFVDFLSGKNRHRRLFGGGKGQSIAKAIGLHKRKNLHVLDATAGLGRDAFVLASLGCQVTLLERSPIIHALLKDGLQRAKADPAVAPIVQRMQLFQLDANDYLQRDNLPAIDVIYLDPMYPSRQKKAKVKKDMRFFHDIVGQDASNQSLLSLARQHASYRVTIKRPSKGDFFTQTPPDFQILDKSTRFDIYLPITA